MKKLLRLCGVLIFATLFTVGVQGAAAMSKQVAAKIDKLIEEAEALEKAGDWSGAESKMTAAVALAPEEPSSYYNRALFRARLNKVESAKEDLDAYLRLKPRDNDGLAFRGQLRLMLNDIDGAIADTNEVLRTYQDNYRARLVRAQAWFARRNYQNALDDYEKLRRAHPEEPLVIVGQAECELNLGNNVAAKIGFQKLVEKFPDNGAMRYKLGLAHFHLQEFDEAIASVRRAAELKMDPAETSKLIGYCHYARHEDEKAIASLRQAIATRPTISPYVYLVLHHAIRRAERSVSESPLRDAMEQWEAGWEKSLARYLLGGFSDRDLVKEAKATKDAKRRDEQLCEAYYYIGATRLLEMDTVAGEVFFERVLGTRASTFFEYTFARAELRRGLVK